MTSESPFRIIKALREITDEVIIGFSGGKESMVCLDLVVRHKFQRIAPVFLHPVPGLSFNERFLAAAEERFGVKIERMQADFTSIPIRNSWMRDDGGVSENTRLVRRGDTWNAMRLRHSINWIVSGERADEAYMRRRIFWRTGGLDREWMQAYPVIDWSLAQVQSYLRLRRLRPIANTNFDGRSFQIDKPASLAGVKRAYPEDYERIRRFFPHVEALVLRWEKGEQQRHEARKLRDAAHPPEPDQGSPVQPENDRRESAEEAEA